MAWDWETESAESWVLVHLQGHHANRFLARGDARRLHLPIQHLHWCLLFGFEFGCLLVAKLGVDEAVKGLGRAHSVQLVHLGCIDGVRLGAVVANGVTNQQAAIFLIQVADPYLDRLRGTLLRRQQPDRLSREQ